MVTEIERVMTTIAMVRCLKGITSNKNLNSLLKVRIKKTLVKLPVKLGMRKYRFSIFRVNPKFILFRMDGFLWTYTSLGDSISTQRNVVIRAK